MQDEDPTESPKGLPIESLEVDHVYKLGLPEEEVTAKLIRIDTQKFGGETFVGYVFKPEGRKLMILTYIPKYKVIEPDEYKDIIISEVEDNPQGGRKKRRTLKKKSRRTRRKTSKLH